MKIENIVPRAGLEPTSLDIPGQCGTITLCRLSDVTTIPRPTMQLLASDISEDYYTSKSIRNNIRIHVHMNGCMLYIIYIWCITSYIIHQRCMIYDYIIHQRWGKNQFTFDLDTIHIEQYHSHNMTITQIQDIILICTLLPNRILITVKQLSVSLKKKVLLNICYICIHLHIFTLAQTHANVIVISFVR